MRVIVVCSYRSFSPYSNYIAPFIWEQVTELKKIGCDVSFVLAKGGGWLAYWNCLKNLLIEIKKDDSHIVHAHGGICGLISNFQRKVPVVTTYHGSDINNIFLYLFSAVSIKYSAYNIFVSKKLFEKAKPTDQFEVIPCGIDTSIFYPLDKYYCREKMGLDRNKIYILFSKAFFVKVKNYPLAKEAVSKLGNAELIELHGYNREEVNLLMNAVDVALLTSFSEGSPQFIKEAMACNCPIVSVDTGDVASVIEGTDGCYLSTYDVDVLVSKLRSAIEYGSRTNGRARIMRFDNSNAAKSIYSIYNKVLSL
jgi:teichuronic acid biosynthesis glycosyltransferase TuaC